MRVTLLAALAASTMLALTTARGAQATQRNADGLPIHTYTCSGVIHKDSEGYMVVGDWCQFWPDSAYGKTILKACNVGDYCSFKAVIVGMAGPFVSKLLGKVQRQ